MYFPIFPFRVLNHLFACNRPPDEFSMCKLCAKIYIKNKKLSHKINKTLSELTDDYFSIQFRYGIITAKNVNLSVQTSAASDDKSPTLCYECTDSLFLLWKIYLDILCRVAFNILQKFDLLLILAGINADCRKYTVCTSSNCLNLKINKVKAVFFGELVNLCVKLHKFSCLSVNPYFVIDVFGTDKRGQYFFGQYLEIKKGRK